jgi:Domain of unknown function (DUF6542)
MPTSPHPDPRLWADPDMAAPRESLDDDLRLQSHTEYADQLFDQEVPDSPRAAAPSPRMANDVYAAPDNLMATEYAAAPGMPARGVIVLSSGAALGCAAVDFALTGGLTIFFDLCFVTVCLAGAMGVRRRDLFTAGVLAPLVLAGVIAVIALTSPHAFASNGGISQVFLSGLAQHAGALVAGYGVALATVAGRVSASRPAPAP